MKEELKNLVEQSEIPIIKNEMDQLRATLVTLSSLAFKTELELNSYKRVTEELAKELAEHLKIRAANSTFKSTNGSERYYRDPTSVAKRWGEWAEMHKAGKPISEIARKWNVHHKSVRHAKSKNFIASITKIPKQKDEPKHQQLLFRQKRHMRQKPHRRASLVA